MTDEAVLFQRWTKHRDADAFTQLASQYAGLVYGTCRRVLGDASEAEDIAQECFLTLAQTNKPPRENIAAWLHRVAINKSRDRMKSDMRRRLREHRYAAEENDAEEPSWKEIEPLIDQAIGELPDELRHVILAHFIEGKPQVDIAVTLNVSRQTVTYRVAKAVEQIRENLRRRGVPVGVSLLTAGLATNMAEAAPAAVIAGIGKLAVAGTATAGAAAGLGALVTTAKISFAGVAVISLIWLGWNWSFKDKINQPVQKVSPLEQTSTATELSTAAITAGVPDSSQANDVNQKVPTDENEDWRLLTGILLDPDGHPAKPDAQVGDELRPRGVNVTAQARSYSMGGITIDDAGHFAFRGYPSLGVKRFAPGDSGLVYAELTDEMLTSEVKEFSLTPEGPHHIDLRLGPAPRISGTLVDASGKPIAGAQVIANWERRIRCRGNPKENGITDSAGHFSIAPVLPGKIHLSAELDDHMRRENDGTAQGPNVPNYQRNWEFDTARAIIAVSPGQTYTDAKLVYNRNQDTIAGHVENMDGNSMAGVIVSAYDHPYQLNSASTTTDGEGSFELPVFGPGEMSLQIDGQQLLDQQSAQKVLAGTRDLVLVVANRYEITGRVVNANSGEPITRIEVGAGGATSGNKTNPDGTFSLTYSGPAETFIWVSIPGVVPQQRQVKLHDGNNDFTFRINAGNPATEIAGTILSPEGAPLPDASVFERKPQSFDFMGDPDTPRGAIAQSDEQGKFKASLLDGIQTLFVYHEDYPLMVVPVSRNSDWTITMRKGGEVSGHVRLESEPLAKQRVVLYFKDWSRLIDPSSQSVETDAEGKYAFYGLPEGKGEVEVQLHLPNVERQYNERKPFATTEAQQVTVDFNIKRPDAVVVGRILTDVQPVIGSVGLQTQTAEGYNMQSQYASINPDGTFRMDGLYAGKRDLVVTLREPVGRTLVKPVTLLPNQETNIEFRFANATAALEGNVIADGIAMQSIRLALNIETSEGIENVNVQSLLYPNGQYRLEKLPAGKATMRVDCVTANASNISRDYPIQLSTGKATVQDIVISGAQIVLNMGDFQPSDRPWGVLVLKGEIEIPNLREITLLEMGKFLDGNRPAYTSNALLEPITCLEPGSYTFLVIDPGTDFDGNRDRPIPELRYGVATAEVPESGSIEVPILVQ